MPRILCIHLPLWPIQRRIAAQPELRFRPLVLHARDGSRGQRIAVGSPAAYQSGVRPGMPLAEAEALANRGQANVSIAPHDPAADREALEQLAIWCEQFSPLVGLEDADEPTCLLLDIAGVARLFGGEDRLLAKITRQFHQRGYRVQLGLGETIGQAWAVANYGIKYEVRRTKYEGRRGEGSTSSRSASYNPRSSKKSIPNPKSQIPNCSQLPPAALRLPEETLQLLDELGITTVEQLQALPRAGLASRFGELLVKRLNQWEGRAKEVIAAQRVVEPFTVSWSLEHPTGKREVVEQVLAVLIDRLCTQLDEQDRGAVQIECRVKLIDRQEHRPGPAATETFTLGLYQPTACAEHLEQLVQLQLDGRRWPGLVSDIRMAAITSAPLEIRQSELFPDQRRERERHLALLVDRLGSRLGRDRVLRPQPQSDALPERAFEYVSPTHREQEKRRRKRSSKVSCLDALSRPLKLHDPPIPVAALAVAPNGPPQRFQFHRWRHTIARQWGPERIETSWWRGRTVRRDYWRVETETGQRFWLFRRLNDGRWFLQGEFE